MVPGIGASPTSSYVDTITDGSGDNAITYNAHLSIRTGMTSNANDLSTKVLQEAMQCLKHAAEEEAEAKMMQAGFGSFW